MHSGVGLHGGEWVGGGGGGGIRKGKIYITSYIKRPVRLLGTFFYYGAGDTAGDAMDAIDDVSDAVMGLA